MNANTQLRKCVKCGKVIKKGEGFTQLGKLYCCENCCKKPGKTAKVCELC